MLGSIACLFSMSLVFNQDSLKLLSDYDTTSKRYESLVPDLAVYLLFAALGFWFGQRQKLAYNMGFILKYFPKRHSRPSLKWRRRRPCEDVLPRPSISA